MDSTIRNVLILSLLGLAEAYYPNISGFANCTMLKPRPRCPPMSTTEVPTTPTEIPTTTMPKTTTGPQDDNCPDGGGQLMNITNCGKNGVPCPPGYYCEVHPTDMYAVCCPGDGCPVGGEVPNIICTEDRDCPRRTHYCDKDENESTGVCCPNPDGNCPMGNQLMSISNCGVGGERCPRGYYCESGENDEYHVCCPKRVHDDCDICPWDIRVCPICYDDGEFCPENYDCQPVGVDHLALCNPRFRVIRSCRRRLRRMRRQIKRLLRLIRRALKKIWRCLGRLYRRIKRVFLQLFFCMRKRLILILKWILKIIKAFKRWKAVMALNKLAEMIRNCWLARWNPAMADLLASILEATAEALRRKLLQGTFTPRCTRLLT